MPNQAGSRCAQCKAHADLPVPLGGAGEKQVGHVRASDQQDKPNNHHHQRSRPHEDAAQLRRDVGLIDGDEFLVPAAIFFRVFFLELHTERVYGGLRLGEGHAGLEARDHGCHAESAQVEPILHHTREGLVMHRHRNPDVGAAENADVVKVARHHADHVVFLLVELDRSPENLRVFAELTAPEGVADQRHGPRRHIFLRRKTTADDRLNAKDVEEVCVDHLPEHLFFLARNREIQPSEDGDRRAGENVVLIAVVSRVGNRRGQVFLQRAAAALRGRVKTDDARWVLHSH